MSVSEISNLTEPRSPGNLIGDALHSCKMTQTELGAKVGVSRQYIGALLNDNEVPSEETLRAIAKALAQKPEEWIQEFKRFKAWSKSPAGIEQKIGREKAALHEQFSLRGARYLNKHEIEAACKAELILVERICPPNSSDGLVIGALNPFAITCHFSGMAESFDEEKDEVVNAELKGDHVVLPSKSTLLVRAQERFRLNPNSMLQFNGIISHFGQQGVRASNEFLSELFYQDSLSLRLDNISKKNIKLRVGEPIASVSIYYNPFD